MEIHTTCACQLFIKKSIFLHIFSWNLCQTKKNKQIKCIAHVNAGQVLDPIQFH